MTEAKVIKALRCRYSGFVLVALLLATCGLTGAVLSQDATTQARIDYETAKLALEQGKPEVALEKLSSVRAVLGDLPELLVFTAQAYFDTGDPDEAKKLLGQALASKDAEFQKSRVFETAIKLSAKIQLDAATADKSFEELGLGNWAEHRDRRRAQIGPCFHEYNGLEIGAKWRIVSIDTSPGRSDRMVQEVNVGPGGLLTSSIDGKSFTVPCSPDPKPKELKAGVSWVVVTTYLEHKNIVSGTEKIVFLGKTVDALLILDEGHGRSSSGNEISCKTKRWLVRGVGTVRETVSCTNQASSRDEMLDYSVPK